MGSHHLINSGDDCFCIFGTALRNRIFLFNRARFRGLNVLCWYRILSRSPRRQVKTLHSVLFQFSLDLISPSWSMLSFLITTRRRGSILALSLAFSSSRVPYGSLPTST